MMRKFTKLFSVLMILLIATSPVFSTDGNSVSNQNQRNGGDRDMDCENFDALTVGGLVAEQLGGMWTTWSGTSADDATVSDAQSNSPGNSFVVDAGAVDLVYQLSDAPITTGKWNYSNYIYVPTGFSGYFNVQSEPAPGVAWVIDLFFDDGGAGHFTVDGEDTEFTYAQDTWIMIQINFDLDADMGEVFFDGESVFSFITTNSIGGIDYYGNDTGGAPGAFYDDVCFGEAEDVPPMDCENFDALTVGGLVADQLGGFWTTWSGTSADDATVSDVYSNSPDNSFVVDAGAVDLVYQLSDAPITTGKWNYSNYIYVPTGFSGYFNVQSEPAPGVAWVIDLFFDDGGAGHFTVDGEDTEFTYAQDTWIMIQINFDLDADMGEVFFDGESVFSFITTNSIGGIDYYGNDTGGTPGAFYDDVCFGEAAPPSNCENFDALTVGGLVAEQLGGMWTTWSGTNADDATVSDAQFNSPDNSFVVDAGAVDLVYQLSDAPIAEGQWLYSNYIYVPTGFSGYFNVQSEPTPGVAWVCDLFFDDGGAGHFTIDGTDTEFTYAQDTWIMVSINFDLDNGMAWIKFDDDMMIEFPTANTIGGIDYYGNDTGGAPGAFYDDVCFTTGDVILSIHEYQSSSINVYPNPATNIVNVKSDIQINSVIVYNYLGQVIVTEKVNTNLYQLNSSQYQSGVYFIQIETNEGIVTKRIIIK